MLRCCNKQLLAAIFGLLTLSATPAFAATTSTDAKPPIATKDLTREAQIVAASGASPSLSEHAPLEVTLQKAKQLMRDGMPSQAYKLLEALEFEQAGNIDFDYLIGIAALDSGKADKASLALERVLAQDANLAGARLDMARAWYVLGDYERARKELHILSGQNPPSAALSMIKQLHNAIDGSEEEGKRSAKWSGYLESGIGYDNNVTSVVDDFTDALLKTYQTDEFTATGNSIKRQSSVVFMQGGGDFSQRFNDDWSMDFSLDAKLRGLPRARRYTSELLDSRAALQYKAGSYKWRFGLSLQRYWQETEAEQTSNHRSSGFFLQWQKSINRDNYLSVMLSGNRHHYFDVPISDGDNYSLSIAWLHQFSGNWRPSLNLTLSKHVDDAKYLLGNNRSNDRDSVGLRAFAQISPRENIDLFASLGFTHRTDRDTNARSPYVTHGFDNLIDSSVGVNWRFKGNWSLHSQLNYSRNNSNLAINRYHRTEVSAAVRFEFP